MPNQRSPGQKLIAFPLDAELLEELDRARGTMNRSQFIREALAYKLGVDDSSLKDAPDRVGKGGPKKTVNYRDELRSDRAKTKKKKP